MGEVSPILDVRTDRDRVIPSMRRQAPAQGLLFSDGEVGQKIVEGPFKSVFSQSAGATVLAAKKNVRYFIHSVQVTVRDDGSHATTYQDVRGTVNGAVAMLARCFVVPSVAGAYNVCAVIDVLLDVNTAVTNVCDVSPTLATSVVTYAEVIE